MIEKAESFVQETEEGRIRSITRFTEVDGNGDSITNGKVRYSGLSHEKVSVPQPDGRIVSGMQPIPFELEEKSLKECFSVFDGKAKERARLLEKQAAALVADLPAQPPASKIIVPDFGGRFKPKN